jgi:hypothetical protein
LKNDILPAASVNTTPSSRLVSTFSHETRIDADVSVTLLAAAMKRKAYQNREVNETSPAGTLALGRFGVLKI